MRITPTKISDVLVIEPTIHYDHRGYFFESFNEAEFVKSVGCNLKFVQDNQSSSSKNVLRGLHYQKLMTQAKLIRVTKGRIFDVAVDIRKDSKSYGQWVGTLLSAQNRKQHWIPEGFAHGFLVLSEVADVLYKTTDYYAPEFERCILWNDPDLAIDWPMHGMPILSSKDQNGQLFSDI